MVQKMSITLLFAIGLFTTNAFSITEHILSRGLAVEYEFTPNEPQVLSNIFFWTIKAVCTVMTDAPDNAISITMLRKTGSVNGIPLTVGNSAGLMINAGDKLSITADSGAKVELINLGNVSIKASCTTA